MLKITIVFAILACVALSFAAEEVEKKGDDLETAAGHHYGGYGGYGGYGHGYGHGGYGGYGNPYYSFGYGFHARGYPHYGGYGYHG